MRSVRLMRSSITDPPEVAELIGDRATLAKAPLEVADAVGTTSVDQIYDVRSLDWAFSDTCAGRFAPITGFGAGSARFTVLTLELSCMVCPTATSPTEHDKRSSTSSVGRGRLDL